MRMAPPLSRTPRPSYTRAPSHDASSYPPPPTKHIIPSSLFIQSRHSVCHSFRQALCKIPILLHALAVDKGWVKDDPEYFDDILKIGGGLAEQVTAV